MRQIIMDALEKALQNPRGHHRHSTFIDCYLSIDITFFNRLKRMFRGRRYKCIQSSQSGGSMLNETFSVIPVIEIDIKPWIIFGLVDSQQNGIHSDDIWVGALNQQSLNLRPEKCHERLTREILFRWIANHPRPPISITSALAEPHHRAQRSSKSRRLSNRSERR